jgi:hypothetical protein
VSYQDIYNKYGLILCIWCERHTVLLSYKEFIYLFFLKKIVYMYDITILIIYFYNYKIFLILFFFNFFLFNTGIREIIQQS